MLLRHAPRPPPRLKYVARHRRGRRRALAAFWIVPFVLRNPYMNDMGWERTTAYLEWLFPWKLTKDIAAVAAGRRSGRRTCRW